MGCGDGIWMVAVVGWQEEEEEEREKGNRIGLSVGLTHLASPTSPRIWKNEQAPNHQH